MAHMTAEQQERVAVLTTQYGKPDRLFLETTDESYGVVRCEWRTGAQEPLWPTRTLFIKPDGTRLTWTPLLT